jgi:hypothetical protein
MRRTGRGVNCETNLIKTLSPRRCFSGQSTTALAARNMLLPTVGEAFVDIVAVARAAAAIRPQDFPLVPHSTSRAGMRVFQKRVRLTERCPYVVTRKTGCLLGNVGCLSLQLETKHA